jgi:dimethylhistidine N-methyltransferase
MNTFAMDVDKGLSSEAKHLSSKYFYDDKGSRIFQQIMHMPEYYLTDSEHEILQEQSIQIVEALGFDAHFNIVELGPGDGHKTFHFLKYLADNHLPVTYIPVDISVEAINLLTTKLHRELPKLDIYPLTGDYFHVLDENFEYKEDPKLLMFLGSNIGNYYTADAIRLLSLFGSKMHQGDKLLIGMDLQKNPTTILNAYNDPAGITRSFNLNLLSRINRELKADFDLDAFDFYCHYNPETGEVKSYLVSLHDQSVHIATLGKSFNFKANELISTELSKKYSFDEISAIAESSGFEVLHHFTDHKQYFTDSLWTKVDEYLDLPKFV